MSNAPLDGLDRVLDVAQRRRQRPSTATPGSPQETVDALAEAGLLGLTVPHAAGGTGGGPDEFLQATRALAARCASSAMIYLMHVCAAQVTLAGTPAGGLRGAARHGVGTSRWARSRSASGDRAAISGHR